MTFPDWVDHILEGEKHPGNTAVRFGLVAIGAALRDRSRDRQIDSVSGTGAPLLPLLHFLDPGAPPDPRKTNEVDFGARPSSEGYRSANDDPLFFQFQIAGADVGHCVIYVVLRRIRGLNEAAFVELTFYNAPSGSPLATLQLEPEPAGELPYLYAEPANNISLYFATARVPDGVTMANKDSTNLVDLIFPLEWVILVYRAPLEYF